MKKLKLIIPLTLLCIVIAFAVYIVFDNHRVVIQSYTYTSQKVPQSFNGFKICLLTDFHSADNYDKIVSKVKLADPDIICVGGDLVDMTDTNFDNAVNFMISLTDICDVYYTYGNHEKWSTTEHNTEDPLIKDALEHTKVKFLNNKVKTITKGDDSINLVGFADAIYDDHEGVFEPYAEKKIKSLYKTLDEDILSVLVFHRAQYFDMISDIGYDLVLSGHIHGGHVNLPYVREKILSSHFNNVKYVKGKYEKGNSTMYVCGGTALKDGVYRVFNTPEIVSIELRSK